MVLGVFPFALSAFPAEEPGLADLLPRWDHTVNLRTGAGYKDNLTLSSLLPEGSGFISTGLELFLWRLPEAGTEFQFLLTADDRRFFSSEAVEKEQILFAQAQVKTDYGNDWQSTFTLEYVYQDQVLDVSVTETALNTVKVKGHSLRAGPAVRREFLGTDWVEFGFPITRQLLQSPLDDYWEGGPKLTVGRLYGFKSEWNLTFAFNYRPYDDRSQTDLDGMQVAGTDLIFKQFKLDLVWRHHWDQERRWRSSTKLSFKQNQDNGSGFFDYNRFQVSEQLRYRAKSWEVSAEVRLSHYNYARQTVSDADSSIRRRAEVFFNVRCEKEFTRWLKIYAEYEYERTVSNLRLDEYSVNTILGGLIWEF